MRDGSPADRSSSDSDSSSELNFGHPRFDALKALYSTKLKVPVPRAKLHDNVSAFEFKQTLLGGFGEKYDEALFKERRAALNSGRKTKSSTVTSNQEVAPVRRFLPHQVPIKVDRPLRARKNIFVRLERGFEGPLGELQRWMNERTRVRIYTRNRTGIRGQVTGRIELFDKHWNLALADVEESWKRRKFRYAKATSAASVTAGMVEDDGSRRLRELGIKLPAVTVRAVGPKHVQCTRRIPKLMMRGEQVVLVTPDDGNLPRPPDSDRDARRTVAAMKPASIEHRA